MTDGFQYAVGAPAGRPLPILTIGHSTHEADAFMALLRKHGVEQLIDVRRYPGSRRVPWTNREDLERRLGQEGVGYLHLEELGGRRRPVKGSSNDGWRVAQFRGYADHMATAPFSRALVELENAARRRPRAVVMCAEVLWWRCHRRLLADALLLRGWPVVHADGRGARMEHSLTEFATLDGDRLLYPRRGSPLGRE